ncbi:MULTISPECIES: hypothetical protein [unclassified Methanoregula]|uniref:hypothetical protein n=1 Tax=unclassified Methanoregula TaxID=2649730 RepID=UPI0009CF0A35|nr:MULTISPECIES: hypothetical protein [unclassified Methanoregula]OPX62657.1 MAG: hypothetical protein A4E33_02205 [Methanoregula sp. PtaB.Bin085]OPY33310.1 MAG: hypothetical protein A4E34_02015 [Methanoregula sp. PtaU1.Bin006]
MDRSEFRTRLEMIDVLLKEQGWDVSDRSKVWKEVDTRQSDFRAKIFRTVTETLTNDMESAYAVTTPPSRATRRSNTRKSGTRSRK